MACLHQGEAGPSGEVPEVLVSRHQWNRLIQATLRDQRIRHARLPSLFQN